MLLVQNKKPSFAGWLFLSGYKNRIIF